MIDEKKLIEELQTLADKESKKCEEAAEANLAGVAATYNHGEICYQNAVETVNSQPKAGEWILRSERLPELEKDVLLSLRSLDVVTGYRSNRKGYFYTNGEGYVTFENVIAWKPLPEPYHE